MPRVLLSLPETENSITRPVILGVVKELYTMTGIPEATRIFYPGEIAKAAQQGRTGPIGNVIGSDEDTVLLTQHAKVFIEVDESIDEDSPQLSDAFRAEHRNIFFDEPLDIAIKPVYRQHEVRINFRYRTEDRTAAQRWRHEMMARLGARMEVRLHTLTYSYPIPLEFLYILKELHRLRENVAGYGQDFESYFKASTDERVTSVVNQTGGNELVVIPETQGRVQGWFDFPEMPDKGNRENETTNWNVGFTYTFKYTKPIAAIMTYPIVIHQQMLSRKYRPNPDSEIPNVPARRGETRSASSAAARAFESGKEYEIRKALNGFSIPHFDEFLPKSVVKDTRRLMTVLCRITESDRKALFQLSDVKDLRFTETFQNFLKTEAPWVTIPYESIVNFSLYKDYSRMHESQLTVSNLLDIRASADLDLRRQYRVRMSLVFNLSRLTPSAVERLRKNGLVLIEIIGYLFPDLLPISLLSDGSVPWKEWIRLVRETAGLRNALNDPALMNKYYNYWGRSSIVMFDTRDISEPIATDLMAPIS